MAVSALALGQAFASDPKQTQDPPGAVGVDQPAGLDHCVGRGLAGGASRPSSHSGDDRVPREAAPSAEWGRRRRTTVAVSVPGDDPGHPKEHVHEHTQRRHDNEQQPEQIRLSALHAISIPLDAVAGAARSGRVG
jgi:hypothetical protein